MGEGEAVILLPALLCPPGLSCSLQARWSMVGNPDRSLPQNTFKLSSKPDLLPLRAINVDVEAKAFTLMWDALYPCGLQQPHKLTWVWLWHVLI